MALLPPDKGTLGDAVPDATLVPLTVTVALASWVVGVTIIDEATTDGAE